MELERKHRGVLLEVAVHREHGELAAQRERTDEEIDAPSLDACRSTAVEAARGVLVVLVVEGEVVEGSEVITKPLELLLRVHAREDLLTNHPHHGYSTLAEQLAERRSWLDGLIDALIDSTLENLTRNMTELGDEVRLRLLRLTELEAETEERRREQRKRLEELIHAG